MSGGQKCAIVDTVEKTRIDELWRVSGYERRRCNTDAMRLSISQAKGQGLHKQIVLLFGGLIEKSALIFFASNESKSVLARDLDDCRDSEIKFAKRILSRCAKTHKRKEKSDVGICESSE